MRRAAVVTTMAGSALAGLILGGVGIADARDAQRSDDGAVPASADPRISKAQAEAIAILAVGGGRVEKIELELEDGGLQWHVDVLKGGTEFDVRIDADTGAVVRFRTDDGNVQLDADDDGRLDDRGDVADRDDAVDDHGDDDRSGPGDGSGDSDDNSGPGSGDDDSSGPGSGGSDDDHSGSGSGDDGSGGPGSG